MYCDTAAAQPRSRRAGTIITCALSGKKGASNLLIPPVLSRGLAPA